MNTYEIRRFFPEKTGKVVATMTLDASNTQLAVAFYFYHSLRHHALCAGDGSLVVFYVNGTAIPVHDGHLDHGAFRRALI